MFFGEGAAHAAMIMAGKEKDRRAALEKPLPMQRKDFDGVFRAMDGFPVTPARSIRRCTSSCHAAKI